MGTSKGWLIAVIVLVVLYGLFHMHKLEIFLDMLFLILLNKVMPIVIVIAIIMFLLKSSKK
ncbi:MAG: hypothetical protein ABL917_04315 [Parcubacteria group bacterium]